MIFAVLYHLVINVLIATIYDRENKTYNNIYGNIGNNSIELSSQRIDSKGITETDTKSLSEFFDIINLSDNKIKLSNYLGYEVYYDSNSGLKHYFKNGQEDFLAFLKFNGTGIKSNSNQSDNEELGLSEEINKVLNTAFQIISNKKNLIITAEICVLLVFFTQFANISKNYLLSKGMLMINDKGKYEVTSKIDTYEEAKALIESSKFLLEEEKAQFCNEELLNDVLPYYDNSSQYYLNLKLRDLQYQYFTEDKKDHGNTVIGYYDLLSPNVINGKSGVSKDKYSGHEYVHLLQKTCLDYIKEATADIVAFEYDDAEHFGYPTQVSVTRLLMDVIGPKIIWEYIFTGNDHKFKKILRDNLSFDEYILMITLLSDAHCGRDKEIIELIGILYRNMYGKEIVNDHNIFSPDGTFIDGRYYFNESKMPEFDEYLVSTDNLDADKNLYYAVYIKEEQFADFKNANPWDDQYIVKSAYVPKAINVSSVEEIIDEEGKTCMRIEYLSGAVGILPIDYALSNDYCEKGKVIYMPASVFEHSTFEDVVTIKHFYVPTNILTLSEYDYELVGNKLKIKINNIRDRFPDQRIRTEENDKLKREFKEKNKN